MKIETRVGLFVVVGLIILVVGIVWKSNMAMRASGYMITGQFRTVSGLLAGGEVRYRGYVVGSVYQVIPGPSMVEVHMYIQNGINIPEGSKLRIDFDGLIGEKFINVLANPEGKRNIGHGAVLPGTAAQGLVDFIDAGTDNLLETKQILAVVRKVLTSDQSQQSLQDIITNIGSITRRTDTLLASIDALISDPNVKNAGKNLGTIFAGLNQAVKGINKLVGKLDQNVDPKDVHVIVGNLKNLTTKLNTMTDAFGKDKDVFMQNAGPIIADTREVIAQTRGLVTNLRRTSQFIEETSVNVQTDVYKDSTYAVGSKISMGANDFEIQGGNDIAGGVMKAKNILLGRKIAGDVRANVGVVNFQPGVRVDVPVNDRAGVQAAVYNPASLSYMLKAHYFVIPNVKALLGIAQDASGSSWTMGVGIDTGDH